MPGAVWLFALFPALATFISFYLEILPSFSYPLSKVIMLLIPFLVWRKRSKGIFGCFIMAGFKRTKALKGLLTGLILGLIIILSYFVIFKDRVDPEILRSKLISLGIAEYYFIAAIFIALWNSALEEWYWRGFLLNELRPGNNTSVIGPAVLNGLFFGLHHFFTLKAYFPTNLTLVFTFGTMVAGGIWAFQRLKGCSILDCYVSHVLTDMAVLWVGWELLGRI